MPLPSPRLSIRDLQLQGKRVFLRADFNVPLDGDRITDDTRIVGALPSIRLALDRGASVVLASHLGRPKGKPDAKYSLAPVARRVQELLDTKVTLTSDCTSDETNAHCGAMKPGSVTLLENLRFHPEEQAGDVPFARRLALLADEYVNDAFGTCHRPDASVAALAQQFERPAAGLLVLAEMEALRRVVVAPERPFVAVLGGAKVSDKLPVIEGLLPLVDAVLVGGAMAYTFLAARGVAVGASLQEPDLFDEVERVLAGARQRGVKIVLPVDHVVAEALDSPTGRDVTGDIPPGVMGLDIGPKTVELFASRLRGARTVLWNGPVGVFEKAPFAAGTRGVAAAVAQCGAYTVVGGGDSVAALNDAGLAGSVSHVSTGGGAMLELIAGADLPGLSALAPAEEARR